LLLNKKKKIPKISNFSKPLEIFGNISENFQKISGNISKPENTT